MTEEEQKEEAQRLAAAQRLADEEEANKKKPSFASFLWERIKKNKLKTALAVTGIVAGSLIAPGVAIIAGAYAIKKLADTRQDYKETYKIDQGRQGFVGFLWNKIKENPITAIVTSVAILAGAVIAPGIAILAGAYAAKKLYDVGKEYENYKLSGRTELQPGSRSNRTGVQAKANDRDLQRLNELHKELDDRVKNPIDSGIKDFFFDDRKKIYNEIDEITSKSEEAKTLPDKWRKGLLNDPRVQKLLSPATEKLYTETQNPKESIATASLDSNNKPKNAPSDAIENPNNERKEAPKKLGFSFFKSRKVEATPKATAPNTPHNDQSGYPGDHRTKGR